MLSDILKLKHIAEAPSRTIIGLMSGTSLDGLDVACCKISGTGPETKMQLLHFKTIDYDADFKSKVRLVFAQKKVDFEFLTLLNNWIGAQHAQMILGCLREWNLQPTDIDLIASHGQTVYHAPKTQHNYSEFSNATLQIGDGDVIAVETGIITISDFRQKHIAAGGEGAPLAAYGDYFLFRSETENRILLNLGGIANYTFLPAQCTTNQIFVTDTGPGNTLIDAMTQKYFGAQGYSFDVDAKFALQGTANYSLLQCLLTHPYFEKSNAKISKTTGPEVFNKNYVNEAVKVFKDSGRNILATLCELTAETVSENIKNHCAEIFEYKNKYRTTIYLSGGGAHNPLVIARLKDYLPQFSFKNTSALGIKGDAKEAILFATLANECVAGTTQTGAGSKNMPAVSMGKISLPR